MLSRIKKNILINKKMCVFKITYSQPGANYRLLLRYVTKLYAYFTVLGMKTRPI